MTSALVRQEGFACATEMLCVTECLMDGGCFCPSPTSTVRILVLQTSPKTRPSRSGPGRPFRFPLPMSRRGRAGGFSSLPGMSQVVANPSGEPLGWSCWPTLNMPRWTGGVGGALLEFLLCIFAYQG